METVLVTGAGGFIAKHVVRELLGRGYAVRGSVRSAKRAAEVEAVVDDRTNLSFVEADLLSDQGWDEAVEGVSAVLHVASPFPMTQPKGRESLVPAAVGGTRRVLDAARRAGVRRVVLTSSIVAMQYRAGRPPVFDVHEDDWSDPEWQEATPYIVSKTRAELAAWEVEGLELTTINPGLVCGPALDAGTSTSLDLIGRLLHGAVAALPPVSFCAVDVRDVAALHAEALVRPETVGRRLLAAGDTMSLSDIAEVLRDNLDAGAAAKVPRRRVPGWTVRLLGLVDPSAKTLYPDLGCAPVAHTGYVTDLTGVRFRSGEEAVVSAAESLLRIKG